MLLAANSKCLCARMLEASAFANTCSIFPHSTISASQPHLRIVSLSTLTISMSTFSIRFEFVADDICFPRNPDTASKYVATPWIAIVIPAVQSGVQRWRPRPHLSFLMLHSRQFCPRVSPYIESPARCSHPEPGLGTDASPRDLRSSLDFRGTQ
jgi:hypothetical protein